MRTKVDVLQREVGVVFEMHTALLQISEPVNNAGSRNGVLHTLVYLSLQVTRMMYVCL